MAVAFVADQISLWLRPSVTGNARAVDGDSLMIDGRSLRLTGLDAPELAQTCLSGGQTYPCGRQARTTLAALLARGQLDCRLSGQDRFDRHLAQCFVGGVDVAADMVRLGWAVADGDYAAEEAQARESRVGIWRGSFQQPADWRRDNPRPLEE